jgi:branched-chain amino acid transport system substrate-binding protein
MKRGNIFRLALMVTLLIIVPTVAAVAEEVLKIGLTLPMTGAAAPWGNAFFRTQQLIAEQYNNSGGITVGGQKYRIEILCEDTKYSPSEGVTVTNKLIFKDKVKFIMGPMGSAEVLATRPLIETNKIVSTIACYTPKALTPENTFTFRTVNTMGEIIGPMFKWVMGKNPGIKKAGLLGPNDESGWSIIAEYISACKRLGLQVVAEEYFERNTTDYYPVLTRILKNQPEILMLDAGTGDLGLILKQAKQMGFKGITITSNPHDAGRLCKVAGQEGAEGHIHSGPYIIPGKIQKWHDQFVARWKEWDATSIDHAENLDLIVAGIKKTNSLDTSKIRDAIETMDFESRVFGLKLKFGGKGRYGIAHQLLKPIFVSQVNNCENVGLVLVPPEEPYPPPEVNKR